MRRHFAYCVIALVASLVTSNVANAQDTLEMPALNVPIPGIAKDIPKDVTLPSDAPNVDALSSPSIGRALVSVFKDSVRRTRGPKDVSLFRNSAPSVVLILTKDGLGSGSLLKNKMILTNYHVVANELQVTVVFKPSDASGKPADDEVVRANVIKIDLQRDLALLEPFSIPSRIRPLDISSQDSIDVGTDVFAIGHPTGEAWTFTKGIVSQFRPAYEWSEGPRDSKHLATVIQTQTPINPGNSGGPLLTEDGKIVGVNSFKARDTEGLNFAVAAKDIRVFLESPKSGLEALISCEKPKVIFEGRNDKNDAFMRSISLRCDDKADIVIFVPDNKRTPIIAFVDADRRGQTEGIVIDQRRSGNWNISFWDPKFDDTFPLKGIHPDGKLKPTRFEKRCPPGSEPISHLKCKRG
jgi:S1-C subfamily serine protease